MVLHVIFRTLFLRSALLFALFMGILFINGCDETTTTTDECSLTITAFSVTPTTLSDLTTNSSGTVTVQDKIGLEDIDLRANLAVYLSTDNTYNSADEDITPFTDDIAHNGTTTTVTLGNFEIPSGTPAGSYFLIARIGAYPCSGGESTTVTSKSFAVTIN